ncbi:hypothetical protein D1872_316010 [compost metagenome]
MLGGSGLNPNKFLPVRLLDSVASLYGIIQRIAQHDAKIKIRDPGKPRPVQVALKIDAMLPCLLPLNV